MTPNEGSGGGHATLIGCLAYREFIHHALYILPPCLQRLAAAGCYRVCPRRERLAALRTDVLLCTVLPVTVATNVLLAAMWTHHTIGKPALAYK